MEPAYLIGAGGAIGAVLRYLVYQLLPSETFPFATLTVNGIGSFVIGMIAFSELNTSITLFVAVGICGAFTTYSTFSFETVELWEDEAGWIAVVNALGNVALCLCAVGIAWVIV